MECEMVDMDFWTIELKKSLYMGCDMDRYGHFGLLK
jgi:hypothetical protein